MRMTSSHVALAALVTALVLSPTIGGAQESPGEAEAPVEVTTPAPVPEPPGGIEAIEVTGESLDATNVQDQSQAITAFDTGALDRLQISNVDRLALNVPGLHVGQQGQNAIITLRGVGTENASITGEPGVAFHVDDVYFGSPAAARTAFFDVETIEVKRGPQGFVGGKNSTSGAIWVKTRDPSPEFELNGDATLGNYDRQRFRGTLNVPLGEFFAARLALFSEARDGYLDRQAVSRYTFTRGPMGEGVPAVVTESDRILKDVGNSQDPFDLDNFGLRGKLRFTPTDTLDWVVGYNYFKEGGNGPQADIVPLSPARCNPQNIIGFNAIPPGTLTTVGQRAGCFAPDADPRNFGDPGPFPWDRPVFFPIKQDDDPRKIYTDFGSRQNDRYWGYSSRLQWDTPALPGLGETTLKLIGGFQENSLDFRWDFDGSDLEIFNLFLQNEVREYTSELQWSGGEILTWQASLFFQRQTGEQRLMSPGQEEFPDPTATTIPNLSSFPAYESTVDFDTEQWTKNKSYGAALHGTYALTDSLSFSLGGRWNKDHKRTFLAQRRILDGRIIEACEAKGGGVDWGFKQTPTDTTPSGYAEAGIPNSCSLTFRGTMWGSRLEWKPADEHLLYAGIDRGYKSGGFASGGIGSYAPERIWAYTLGTKSEFFDNRLQLNLEGFVYNYSDMQLTLLDATKVRTENADARMYGYELELRASPLEGLRLQGLFAYLHTETRDYYTLDPATLGEQPNATRVITRERFDRQGRKFPDNTTLCQNASVDRTVTPPRFIPPRLCSDFGVDGLDDYSGNQLSRSPELKWNISAEYDIPLGRFGTLTPGIQYAWQDEAYYRVFNRDFDRQEAYHETNLHLLWQSPEQRWEVDAFINNIENDAVKQNILISPSTFGSIPLAWYGEPRFYGVRVGFKY